MNFPDEGYVWTLEGLPNHLSRLILLFENACKKIECIPTQLFQSLRTSTVFYFSVAGIYYKYRSVYISFPNRYHLPELFLDSL